MSDRSKRNQKEKQDRVDLAAYRLISPSPYELLKEFRRLQGVEQFVNTIGSRRKPYFKPGELPK